MRKTLKCLAALAMAVVVTGCSYDDDALWKKVNEIDGKVALIETQVSKANGDVTSLQGIVKALQEGKVIKEVAKTKTGYKLVFNDGEELALDNGAAGKNAPVVGVKKADDGQLYWTMTTDGTTTWLAGDDGSKLAVSGQPGLAGLAGITPVMGIDEDGYWTVDTGDGPARVKDSRGHEVKAQGQPGVDGNDGNDGDSFLEGITTTDDGKVVITLANGTAFTVPMAEQITFTIAPVGSLEIIKPGLSKTYTITQSGVTNILVTKPDGWKVVVDGNTLTVTAPVEANLFAELTGTITLAGVGQDATIYQKMDVSTYELRVLTFEDADYRGSGTFNGGSTWSDLIDSPQYGGPLLYGTGMGFFDSSEAYQWYDEGNTELAHQFPFNWGSYCYWGGGEAISNYVEMDLSNGNSTHQLSVYTQDPVTGKGGHNGSDNFAMHYGYTDDSGYATCDLSFLYFADGVERVIDHMYVMNSTYAMSCFLDGNGFTAAIGEDDWVKVVAIGYDSSDTETARCEISMVDGPDNIIREWTKWDLTSLGKVARIEFNVTGNNDNGYGFSQPAYFAYDDIAVRF